MSLHPRLHLMPPAQNTKAVHCQFAQNKRCVWSISESAPRGFSTKPQRGGHPTRMRRVMIGYRCAIYIFAAALLSGCGSIYWGSEFPCASPISESSTFSLQSDLQILTWNLHGTPEHGPREGRFKRIAVEVLRRQPDIVLFQEVWFKDDANVLQAGWCQLS